MVLLSNGENYLLVDASLKNLYEITQEDLRKLPPRSSGCRLSSSGGTGHCRHCTAGVYHESLMRTYPPAVSVPPMHFANKLELQARRHMNTFTGASSVTVGRQWR